MSFYLCSPDTEVYLAAGFILVGYVIGILPLRKVYGWFVKK